MNNLLSPPPVQECPDDRPLIDQPLDQLGLSLDDEAIQAVVDGEGPGLCHEEIIMLTAVAAARGDVACVAHPEGHERDLGTPCQLRRVRRFRLAGGAFVPVP
jgi:hypothetical protein